MIIIERLSMDDKSVNGRLLVDGVEICQTLENHSKLIPDGCYRYEVNKSPAFSKKRGKDVLLPLIYNSDVPASRGIRLHAGNSYEDSKGCVLVGVGVKDGWLVKAGDTETFLTNFLQTYTGDRLVYIVTRDID